MRLEVLHHLAHHPRHGFPNPRFVHAVVSQHVRQHQLVRAPVVLDDVDVRVEVEHDAHRVRERVFVQLVRAIAHRAYQRPIDIKR